MGVAADMDMDAGGELETEEEEVGMPLELEDWTRLISRIEKSHSMWMSAASSRRRRRRRRWGCRWSWTTGPVSSPGLSDPIPLFNRALSFVGKDYSRHALWDKYIEFEFAQQSWASLAHIYILMLRFPTKKLKSYYDRFRKLVDLWSEEMNAHHNSTDEVAPELLDAVKASYKQSDIDRIIEELVDPSLGLARTNALHNYINIGEHYHQKSS